MLGAVGRLGTELVDILAPFEEEDGSVAVDGQNAVDDGWERPSSLQPLNLTASIVEEVR